MTALRFRRACFLLVAFALVIGLPLPVDGLQGAGMMAPPALAAAMDGAPCDDCECCKAEGMMADTTTCMTGCGGMVASLPHVKGSALAEWAISFAGAFHRAAGVSVAPDPSPPKFPILT